MAPLGDRRAVVPSCGSPRAALLVVAGAIGFLATRGQLEVARQGLLSTVVVVAGPGAALVAVVVRDDERPARRAT